jgi:hypothetical protein
LLLRPNSYADAKGWDDLVHAFTESLKHSSLDEMILLVHTTVPGPYGQRPEYVRLVTYNTLDELPQLLLSTAPSASRTSVTPAHQERQRVKAGAGVPPDDNEDGRAQQEHVEISQERVDHGKEAEAVTSGGDHEGIEETRVNAAKAIQDAYRRHSERKRTGAAQKIQATYCRYLKRRRTSAAQKIQTTYLRYLKRKRTGAAQKIQATYRRYLKRKRTSAAQKIQTTYRRYLKQKSVVGQGIDATQAHYWHLLRKRSLEMGWIKDSRYYILFRFPLAYILVCLDVIKSFAESGKKEAKKLLMTAGHRGIEGQMEVINQYGYDSVSLHITLGV